MTNGETKRMGRPPRTSASEILAAAATMDPGQVQMTAVASALGISVKTVYYYFPTRTALVEALADRSVRSMGLPDFTTLHDWRAILEELARWAYSVGRDFPDWSADTAGSSGVGVQVAQRSLVALAERGWTPRDALLAQNIVGNWALGAGRSVRRSHEGRGSSGTPSQVLGTFMTPSEVASVEAVMATVDEATLFETGLAVVLAGMADVLPSVSDAAEPSS